MTVSWTSPVTAVVTSRTSRTPDAKALTDSGVATVGDLLGLFPRRYVRKGSLSELDELTEGDLLTLVGEVVSAKPFTYQDRRTHRTAYRLEVRVRAEGNETLLLTYFDRQKHTAEWRANKELAPGRVGLFVGRLKWFRDEWQLTNPESRMYDDSESTSTMPDLIPLYPAVAGVNPWHLEAAIGLALELVEDPPEVLPLEVREAEDLLPVDQALRWIHRPDTWAQKVSAEKRLKYDEAFVAQTVLARRRAAIERTAANPRPGVPGGLLDRFDERLPFALTDGQRHVGEEIAAELGRGHPMHRLLQGEVGSGKTVVAVRAMLQVIDSGGQAALLAPTEVLAQQHHRSVVALLGDLAEGGFLGGAEDGTRVALLTGSLNAASRRQAMADAAGGEAGIVIGTHALLEENVQFADLGLVVVDEQHRFGVEQRAALSGKAGSPPHVLVMTATPIPRTVAMTVFGDLDTSTLSELPAGRGDVQTTVVPTMAQPGWLDRAWQRVREEVGAGRQAYVVASRIDPGDGDEDKPLHAVEELAPELAAGPFSGLRVEMLHGRMAPEEKDRVMRAFAAGDVDVLVSTTVIEVGVDVPNATVMVVLDADRFGVSQLHQLRGRIGRGGHAGLCLLVSGAEPGSLSMERLSAVAATRDGFELSRIDLEQRREGNVLGTQQSGGRGGGLKLLSVLRDEEIIESARTSATEHLARDPELAGVPDLALAVADLEDSERAEFLELGMTRIIGGSAGGRRLRTPAGEATRPTSDRVREALFSTLESQLGSLTGLRFLDLYAGSGAVGLEARSRGAGAVTAIESDRRTARLAEANAATLGFDHVEVLAQPVARALSVRARSPYDVVFADPPYPLGDDEVAEALGLLVSHDWVAAGSVVVVERSARSVEPAWPAGLARTRKKEYGETVLWYVRADSSETPEE